MHSGISIFGLKTKTRTGLDRTSALLAATALSASLLFAGAPQADATTVGAVPVDLYLLMGQSNAKGQGVPAGLSSANSAYAAATTNVMYHDQDEANWGSLGGRSPFGFELGLGRDLFASSTMYTSGQRKLAIAKVAHGGTSSTEWVNTLLDPAMSVLNRDIDQLRNDPTVSEVNVVELIWVQGEADVLDGAESVASYTTRFNSIHSSLRTKVAGAHQMPARIVHLNPNFPVWSGNEDAAYWNVNVAQLASDSTLVEDFWPQNAEAKTDGIHYTSDSFINVGRQLATVEAAAHNSAIAATPTRETALCPTTQIEFNGTGSTGSGNWSSALFRGEPSTNGAVGFANDYRELDRPAWVVSRDPKKDSHAQLGYRATSSFTVTDTATVSPIIALENYGVHPTAAQIRIALTGPTGLVEGANFTSGTQAGYRSIPSLKVYTSAFNWTLAPGTYTLTYTYTGRVAPGQANFAVDDFGVSTPDVRCFSVT